MESWFTVILILICMCLEGLYSGVEIAYISSDINRIRHRAKDGSKSSLTALRMLEMPEKFLATTLTGTNLFIVTSSTLATGLFISLFGALHGEIISLLVMVPTLMVMIVARSLFQQHAESMTIMLSRFVWLSSLLFYPAVFLVSKISGGTVKKSLASDSDRAYSYVTKDGLKYILEEQGQKSDIQSTEKDMVKNIIDFSDVTVDKIMVPLSAVVALPVTTTFQEALHLAASKKLLRVPVYREQIINVIGILEAFDLLESHRVHASEQSVDYREETIEPYFRPVKLYIPETKLAIDVLVELKSKGERMAVVVDEYGGAVGIVTIEDILEEIVGEIEDEYESGEKMYKKIDSHKYILNARMSIEKVRQLLPIEIPDGGYETIGGFILFKMGRIPGRKERLKYGNIIFVIEDADRKSIKEVLVILPTEIDKSA